MNRHRSSLSEESMIHPTFRISKWRLFGLFCFFAFALMTGGFWFFHQQARGIREQKSNVPAVQSALGQTGEFVGRDYRGVDILAEIMPVPGTPGSWL
jgi:hypothetical protein